MGIAAWQAGRQRMLRFEQLALAHIVLQRRVRAHVVRMQARQGLACILAIQGCLQGQQIARFLRQHFDFHAARGFLLRVLRQRVRVGQGQGEQRGLLARAQGGQL
ncbi:hypothetical protein JaAD80_27580 [Janthinobacterium sp. AD80]|nr:hypothetical protein JaAD80_27580 [Janthinobacterium sp. AD80]